MTGTGKLRSTARVALVIAVFGGAWSVRPASAEPTFLSKQYSRCTACHYSAAGGGLLTPCGRSLSREEISTFGRQGASGVPSTGSTAGEEGFLFDALSSESPLPLGLDVRPSHLEVDVPGRTIADRNERKARAATLGRHAADLLDLPVDRVGKPEVLRALERAWTSQPGTGRKLRTALGAFFRRSSMC